MISYEARPAQPLASPKLQSVARAPLPLGTKTSSKRDAKKMPVEVKPMSEADIPTAVRLQLDAFEHHPRTPIAWPNGYTPDLYEYYESVRRREINKDTCRFMKAVNSETGQLVGISEWTFQLQRDLAAEAAAAARTATDPPPANWPAGGNWEMRRWYKINLQKLIRNSFGDRPYILLDILTIDPTTQGQGVGSRLLEWGVKHADEFGVMMGLESTPAGLALYKKFGFKEAGIINADMNKFGLEGSYDIMTFKRVWMVREPQARTA